MTAIRQHDFRAQVAKLDRVLDLALKGYPEFNPDQARGPDGQWVGQAGGITRREFIRNRGLRAAAAIAGGLGLFHLPLAGMIIHNLVLGRPWHYGVAISDEEAAQAAREQMERIKQRMEEKGYRFEPVPGSPGRYHVYPPTQSGGRTAKGYPEVNLDQPRGPGGQWSGGGAPGTTHRRLFEASLRNASSGVRRRGEEALRWWAASGEAIINPYLREHGRGNRKADDAIAALDKLFDRASLSEEMTVHSFGLGAVLSDAGARPGSIVINDGYTPTTSNASSSAFATAAQNWGERVTVVLP